MASEFDLIEKYFSRRLGHTELGVGDDAALVRPSANNELVISTDLLVEGTHFFSDVDPASLGWKALAVNLSDMAAMGATPRWATLGCVLCPGIGGGVGALSSGNSALRNQPVATAADSVSDSWLGQFSLGFFSCAGHYDVDLIGGDTTRGPSGATTFSITIIGEVPPGQALRRSGAQSGDDIWVSGTPGRAAMGLAHLQRRVVLSDAYLLECVEALQRPTPRIELGLALRKIATSAIDISDGLLADLGHVLKASGASATLQIPGLPDAGMARDAYLAGGDDYELIFTVATRRATEITAIGEALRIPLHKIGTVGRDNPGTLSVFDHCGVEITPSKRGFDHFGHNTPENTRDFSVA